MVPSQLRVRVTRRPRYACHGCESAVVVAPAPDRPVDGGMATEALIAHVVVSKFADSLPLYRQVQMLERQGIKLDRSTLANWVGRACWWLTPLYELMLGTVLAAPKVFADDTTLPVLDPGRGRTKTGRLWCYAVDDRPWRGPGHPMAAYVYSSDRKNERPAGHLAGFRGVLQVDGYNGFKALADARADASVTLAFCWSHMRRCFYDEYVSNKSPLAAEVLVRVRTLYAIEAEIRGHPAEHRHAVRQERSRPIVEALHGWLQDQVKRVSGPSDLAKAMRYAIRHWPGLVVFLDDGRVEMDTNVVERAIRPNTPTRKNALFAGSDGGAKHWALAMTLIQTAKLNGVDPLAWLTDVLERIVSGRTKAHEMQTLLPWTWQPSRPTLDLHTAASAAQPDRPAVSVASEAFWWLDGLKLLEVQIADRPQRLGSSGLLQRLRQRVEPSLILGLQLDPARQPWRTIAWRGRDGPQGAGTA